MSDISPEKPKDKDTIRISIIDTDGKKSEFEIRKTVPLKKLYYKYCEMKHKNPDSLVMTHMDLPIDMSKSSEELKLDNNAKLSIVGRQVGG